MIVLATGQSLRPQVCRNYRRSAPPPCAKFSRAAGKARRCGGRPRWIRRSYYTLRCGRPGDVYLLDPARALVYCRTASATIYRMYFEGRHLTSLGVDGECVPSRHLQKLYRPNFSRSDIGAERRREERLGVVGGAPERLPPRNVTRARSMALQLRFNQYIAEETRRAGRGQPATLAKLALQRGLVDGAPRAAGR